MGLWIHILIVIFSIASQSRNICTQLQKGENCDLVQNVTKNDKNGIWVQVDVGVEIETDFGKT